MTATWGALFDRAPDAPEQQVRETLTDRRGSETDQEADD
ncbi:MAG: hypothetical protein ACI9CA_002255 [Natronomonas sp.]|jgi:hypothetical protein